jgi:hypothetical protein
VQITTLDGLISKFGMPDYVKIDVEGFELEVIRGLSKRIALLSFECNLPEFLSESIEIVRTLESKFGGVRFNFVITEPPTRFESKSWIDANNLIVSLRHASLTYAEIYCQVPD